MTTTEYHLAFHDGNMRHEATITVGDGEDLGEAVKDWKREVLGGETTKRTTGCGCHQEEGDSPCLVHGEENQ